MHNFSRAFLLATAAISACGMAAATTVTYNASTDPATVNIADQRTDYADISVQIPFFDPSRICLSSVTCVLNSVAVTLTGDIVSDIRFESLDAAPATVQTKVAGTISLSNPGGSKIVVTLPAATSSVDVTAFDGTVDFGGTSGRTFTGISSSDTQTAKLTNFADIVLFTGTGALSLPVSAQANTLVVGLGNLITQFSTMAGAAVSVTYDYTASDGNTLAVTSAPEPATFAMLGGVLLVLGALRKRSNSK